MGWNHQLVLTHIAGGGEPSECYVGGSENWHEFLCPPRSCFFFGWNTCVQQKWQTKILGGSILKGTDGVQQILSDKLYQQKVCLELWESHSLSIPFQSYTVIHIYIYIINNWANLYDEILSYQSDIWWKFDPTKNLIDSYTIPWSSSNWIRQAVGLREGPVVVDPRCRPEVRLGWIFRS